MMRTVRLAVQHHIHGPPRASLPHAIAIAAVGWADYSSCAAYLLAVQPSPQPPLLALAGCFLQGSSCRQRIRHTDTCRPEHVLSEA